MSQFSIYDSKGEITQRISGGKIYPSDIPENGGYIEGWFDQKITWINGGEPTVKPMFALPDSMTGNLDSNVTIDGLLVGTHIKFPNGEYTVKPQDNNQVTWSSAVTGEFTFVFNLFPYQTLEMTIVIT